MTDFVSISRGFKGHIAAVGAGAFSAALCAFALGHADSPWLLLAYLGSMPLFLAGFGAGAVCGLLACLVGTVGLFALAPAGDGLFYLLADALPAAGLVVLAMRRRATPDGGATWTSEGAVLTALAAYPCVIFLGVFAATAAQGEHLLTMTLGAFDTMTDQVAHMLAANGEKVTPQMTLEIRHYLSLCARIAPALVMCAWLFTTFVDMIVAQGLLRQRQWVLRPPFALARLHIPTWVIFAAAAVGLAAAFAPAPYDYVGLNLAIIMGVPFFFVGVAVMHAWAARTRAPVAALIIFYVAIIIFVQMALLVAVLGAVDQWVNFRKRFAEQS